MSVIQSKSFYRCCFLDCSLIVLPFCVFADFLEVFFLRRVVLVFFFDLAEGSFHVIVVLALHAGRVTAIVAVSLQIFHYFLG